MNAHSSQNLCKKILIVISLFLLFTMFFLITAKTIHAELQEETTQVPEFPQTDIQNMQKQANEARRELLAIQNKGPQPNPLPLDMQTSLILSQINAAEAQINKLRNDWMATNRTKILNLLKNAEDAAAQARIESQNRQKRAQEAADLATETAKLKRQIAQEVIQRTNARLQSAQAEAQTIRQNLANPSEASAWHNATATLEEMIQEKNATEKNDRLIAQADQQVEMARREGEAEQQQAVRFAEKHEKRAKIAQETLQAVLMQNRLEADALNARMAKIQQLIDKVLDKNEAVMAKTPTQPVTPDPN